MKICSRCKVNETRNLKQYTCSKCHNEYQKQYYKTHPRSIDASARRRKEKIRSIVRQSKDVPCFDCGIKYPYFVMDFDHQKDKKFNLSQACNKYRSIETVLKEIEKCEVVCANCHRIRTHK